MSAWRSMTARTSTACPRSSGRAASCSPARRRALPRSSCRQRPAGRSALPRRRRSARASPAPLRVNRGRPELLEDIGKSIPIELALTCQYRSDIVDCRRSSSAANLGPLPPGKQEAAVLGQAEQGLAVVSARRSDRAIQPTLAGSTKTMRGKPYERIPREDGADHGRQRRDRQGGGPAIGITSRVARIYLACRTGIGRQRQRPSLKRRPAGASSTSLSWTLPIWVRSAPACRPSTIPRCAGHERRRHWPARRWT